MNEHTPDGADSTGESSGSGGTDPRRTRQLIESLVSAWQSDAELLGDEEGGSDLLASAGEAVEFAIGDEGRARALYTAAAAHPGADSRAFAGLRRFARQGDKLDPTELASWYQQELAAAATPSQALTAAIGFAQCSLRSGVSATSIAATLREAAPLLSRAPHDLAAAFRATLEDVLFAADEPADALRLKVSRWGDMRVLGEDVAEAHSAVGALAIAVASEVVGSDEAAILDWYEVAFELRPTLEAGRPLMRACFDAGDSAGAEAILGELSNHTDDTHTRSLLQYEVGMLRATRLDDRPGGLAALGEAMKGGDISPLAAASYLALARSSQGTVVADDYIDALGASLDFAASGVERADLLTQMAERFDCEQAMTETAIDLARDALDEAPDYVPALRLLGSLYGREGRWQEQVELTERQLEREQHPEERFRLHDQLAERYDRELQDPAGCERHLRAALEIRADLSIIRRSARLLSEQYRWQELFEHLRTSAHRVDVLRETAYLLERAGEIAESRLRDGELAIDIYRELLELDPQHPSAMSALGRLLSRHERWGELLALNERELAMTDDENARVGILCRSAEIARVHLGDVTATELYYQRALEEDPACSAALRGLGHILSSQSRWADVVDMTQREREAARSEQHRLRCLQMLGELHATRTGEREKAISCFEALAASETDAAEGALVWLERLFEADADHSERLRVLSLRQDLAVDPQSRSRLSFRMAELLEWHLYAIADAFDYYIEALGDDVAAAVALEALDRLWQHEDVTDDMRRTAVQCLRSLAGEREDEIRRAALLFLADRAHTLLGSGERIEMMRRVAAEWPEDVRASESCAVAALQAGDSAAAEELRAACSTGPVESLLAAWACVDRGMDATDILPAELDRLPTCASLLAREVGAVDDAFDGGAARDTYLRLGAGSLSLGELTQPDDTEAGLRLAAYAFRALGDDENLSATLEDLASRISPPVRAMRVWLELATDERFSREQRTRWLSEASALGCYETPARQELYDAMTLLGAWAELESALLSHLQEARPESERAARLSLRRGRCLEALNRREDAVDALRFSAIHAPADAAIALEKARLESVVDDLDAARATLEDCLNAGVDGDGRIDLLGRLADLHQMQGGVRQRALSALEDALVLSGREPEWCIRLASAHASFGQPQRCVELLESALPTPIEESDIRHWQLLAKTLATHLGDQERAEDILWTLFEDFPNRKITLTGLEEFYRKFQGARAFADRLGELLAEEALEVSAARAAELWRYIGELYFSVLERHIDAENAFIRARKLSAPTASLLLREAKAVGSQPGRMSDAAKLAVEALGLGQGEPEVWEDAAVQLEGFYDDLGEPGRLRVVRQLRRALGSEVSGDDGGMQREPSRGLEHETAWRLLGPHALDRATVGVLQGAVGLAEKVFADYAPS
ncbi:MAG: tetratricopeptide (TPR) repeat protein, partial [Flavobacteriales bacterium]